MRRELIGTKANVRWHLLLTALSASSLSHAQQECAQRYDDAKALFDAGDRKACIATITTVLADCHKDRDLSCRLLFLKSLAEAGEDSLERMRSDLEHLFRTDRHYVIKAYDPLMKGKPGEADLYGAWEQLHGDLRKDLGQWRAGAHLSLVFPLPRSTTDRKVFEDDVPLELAAKAGWEMAAEMEWDVVPNLAVRLTAGYAMIGYEASNNAITYKEAITQAPFSFAMKKMFWLKRSPFVPFASLGAATGWILSDQADIVRDEGSDTRYLKALSVDRLSERRQRQYWGEGSLGVARKTGSAVFSLEVVYNRSFTPITTDDAPYTNTELMSDFYYVDNEIFLDRLTIRVSAQYILAYHSKNRIHP